jgi:hypothetical protein
MFVRRLQQEESASVEGNEEEKLPIWKPGRRMGCSPSMANYDALKPIQRPASYFFARPYCAPAAFGRFMRHAKSAPMPTASSANVDGSGVT